MAQADRPGQEGQVRVILGRRRRVAAKVPDHDWALGWSRVQNLPTRLLNVREETGTGSTLMSQTAWPYRGLPL